MGNSNAVNKCDLQQYSDVCEMTECLDGSHNKVIFGIGVNSASPTDTWIVKFKDGTTYDEEPIKKAFLKMWISNSSYNGLNENNFRYSPSNPNDKREIFEAVREHHVATGSSLNYEARVYRDIVKPMIEKNICPNFIKFLGLGKNCTIESLLKMLKLKNPNENLNLNQLYGTAVSIMFDLDRKAITTSYSDEDIVKFKKNMSIETFKENIKYNIMVNEVIEPGTVDFSDFLRKHEVFLRDGMPNPIVWNVIFQILAACYAMSKTKMNHNDLHLGNIYIEPVFESGGKRFNYEYENTIFTFESQYIAKVYDFDRSYVTRFGNNPLLEFENEFYCEGHSQCNEFIPNLDALKIMSGVYRRIQRVSGGTGMAKKIIDLCTSIDPTKKKTLTEIFNKGNFLLMADNTRALNLENFDNVLQIMKNVSDLSNIENMYPSGYIPELKDVFICNQTMFNDSGKILEKFSRTQQDNSVVEGLKQQIFVLEEQVKSLKDKLQKETRIPPKQRKDNTCPPGEVRDKQTKECRPKMRRNKQYPKSPCPPDRPIRDKQTKECRQRIRRNKQYPKSPCPPDRPVRDKQTKECREDKRKKK